MIPGLLLARLARRQYLYRVTIRRALDRLQRPLAGTVMGKDKHALGHNSASYSAFLRCAKYAAPREQHTGLSGQRHHGHRSGSGPVCGARTRLYEKGPAITPSPSPDRTRRLPHALAHRVEIDHPQLRRQSLVAVIVRGVVLAQKLRSVLLRLLTPDIGNLFGRGHHVFRYLAHGLPLARLPSLSTQTMTPAF